MGHDDLVALAKKRGVELPSGYVRNDVIAAMLRAQDGPAAESSNEGGAVADAVAAPVRPAGVVYVSRTHLMRMSRGEVIQLYGVRLAADDDFPPYWSIQR